MVRRALRGEDITVFNDGTQIRSWCYVGDFVQGLTRALSHDEAVGEVFNLGNPQATITVLGLAQTIIRMTGSRSGIVFKPHPGPEVEMRVPDISKARKLLGYEPTVGLEEGLAHCIEWYREHLDT
jgi:nucleoside-diphosphate-sugar epimerase